MMDNQAAGERWSFGAGLPVRFARHIGRSVPSYEEGHRLVVQLSDFFVRPDSTCYELGVATGSLIKKLAKHHAERGQRDVRWVGIDREPAMIEQAILEIAAFDANLNNIDLVVEDLENTSFESTDYVVSYYTVQFMALQERPHLFQRIYQALNRGGALVLFEKIRGVDARFQDILTTLYQDYKLGQGHTSAEILAKVRGLKGVLEPASAQGNLGLLGEAGFEAIQPIFQHLCFQGLLAIK